MKANELRIGNWIQTNISKEPVKVLGVKKGEILDSGVWDYTTRYEPIPLTEEWLLKFGFEKIRGVYWFVRGAYFEYEGFDTWTLYQDEQDYLTDLKHVHQLQNLYFALTGDELTIK